MSPDEEIEASFRQLIASLDDAWKRWRALRPYLAPPPPDTRPVVDTLSDSLATPESK